QCARHEAVDQRREGWVTAGDGDLAVERGIRVDEGLRFELACGQSGVDVGENPLQFVELVLGEPYRGQTRRLGLENATNREAVDRLGPLLKAGPELEVP